MSLERLVRSHFEITSVPFPEMDVEKKPIAFLMVFSEREHLQFL